MGNRQGYKHLETLNDNEYENFAELILKHILHIRFGSKGFTTPIRIRRQTVESTFLHRAPKNFDENVWECWEKLITFLELQCDVDYNRYIPYESEEWCITFSNLDKRWSRMDKLANFTIIHWKALFWKGKETDVFQLPNIMDKTDWFDKNDPEMIKDFYSSLEKIGKLRCIPYNLKSISFVKDQKILLKYPM